MEFGRGEIKFRYCRKCIYAVSKDVDDQNLVVRYQFAESEEVSMTGRASGLNTCLPRMVYTAFEDIHLKQEIVLPEFRSGFQFSNQFWKEIFYGTTVITFIFLEGIASEYQ